MIAVLSGYAWSIPANLSKRFNDLPANWLILMLELLGGIYLFYQFKSRHISFNYTFIDREQGYWSCVLWNIGKLALILLPVYAIPALLLAWGQKPAEDILSVLWAWLASVVGLGLQYLLISWAERAGWQDAADESRTRISRAWLIMGITATVIWMNAQLWSLAGVLWSLGIGNGLWEAIEGGGVGLFEYLSYGEVLADIQATSNLIGYTASAYLGMFLCYLLPGIKEKAPAAGRCIRYILCLTALQLLWSMLIKISMNLWLGGFLGNAPNVLIALAYTSAWVVEVLLVISLIFWWMLTLHLCRDFKVGRGLIAVPFLKIVLALANVFPWNNIGGAATVWYTVIRILIGLGEQILFMLLLWRHTLTPVQDVAPQE